MRLRGLERDTWTVTAIEERTNGGLYQCPFTESLMGLGPNYDKSVDGLLALLERFSQHGVRMLNSDLCHEADSANKIFEFIKGDLRLLWFYGSGKQLVICSHVFLKKGRKTPANEKQRAIDLKNLYMKMVADKEQIELIWSEED